MPSPQLKWITNRAKQIRKSRPSMKWSSAIKQAGADYRREKPRIGSTTTKKAARPKKRKVSTKKRSIPKAMPKRKISGPSTPRKKKPTGMAGVRATARKSRATVKEALGDAMTDQYLATTKTEKRKIGKRVSMLKSQLRTIGKLI